MQQIEPSPAGHATQDSLYQQAAEIYGPSLDRLARAYEFDEARRDLLQEIHLHLWRSCALFDQRCSLRTWVYRVAHNVATGHVIRQSRIRSRLVSIPMRKPNQRKLQLEIDGLTLFEKENQS